MKRANGLVLIFSFFTFCQSPPAKVEGPVLTKSRKYPNGICSEDTLFRTSETSLSHSIEAIKQRMNQADSLLEYGGEKEVKIVFQLNSQNFQVADNHSSWPAVYQQMHVAVFAGEYLLCYSVSPFSEHGRFFLRYSHYYEKGELVGFRRESNFYGSECANAILFETSHYFYSSGELIAKDYWVKNAKDEILDPADCVFPFHFDYDIYSQVPQGVKEMFY